MFHEALSKTNLTDLPVLALILFFAIFVIVSLRVLLRRRDDPALERLASLPLDDDTSPETRPGPTDPQTSSTPDEGALP